MAIYQVIGLMSGSSLDGIDLAWCTFAFSTTQPTQLLRWEFHAGETISYSPDWQHQLRTSIQLPGRELWHLHTHLGLLYGQEVKAFADRHQASVDFVASHGHTVFHDPQRQTTTQIGDGAAMAAVLQLPVIDQFRTQDMALGGQGAPLAPLADQYLFPKYFACLNLGGIANISLRTPGGYVAYDITGANQVLDALMGETGVAYDEDGQLARTGKVIPELLEQANRLPYLKMAPPKSLGNDWVQKKLLPLFQNTGWPLADRLHTLCVHVAEQTGASIRQVAEMEQLSLGEQHHILVTGGGAFNGFLCEQMAKSVQPLQLEIASPDIIAYKEAILMGLAGALRWQQQPNVLPSVTGASRAAVGGAIHWG
ncbi:MAG: anhydro-N-acetylmuramic acid kinase [Bacteroidota bacterium]